MGPLIVKFYYCQKVCIRKYLGCRSTMIYLLFVKAENSNVHHFWLKLQCSLYKLQRMEKLNAICLHINFCYNHHCHWQCTAIDCYSKKFTAIWLYSGCNWHYLLALHMFFKNFYIHYHWHFLQNVLKIANVVALIKTNVTVTLINVNVMLDLILRMETVYVWQAR